MRAHILTPPTKSHSRVLFLDLDNTLYPKSTGLADQFQAAVTKYIAEHLPQEEVSMLPKDFYKGTGLAIRGIKKHFPEADTGHFNEFIESQYVLDEVVTPVEPSVVSMLESIKDTHCWIFTNAGINYALKVLSLLAILHLFEGIVYCDYDAPTLIAKPDPLAFHSARELVGIGEGSACLFVDDSPINIHGAVEVGWEAVHFDEEAEEERVEGRPKVIRSLLSLPAIAPELFN